MAHPTNAFSSTFQILPKFHFAFILIISGWLLQNFAHGTTAMLSCHVQNFVAISWLEIILLSWIVCGEWRVGWVCVCQALVVPMWPCWHGPELIDHLLVSGQSEVHSQHTLHDHYQRLTLSCLETGSMSKNSFMLSCLPPNSLVYHWYGKLWENGSNRYIYHAWNEINK